MSHRILVIEDDDPVRDSLTTYLGAGLGYAVKGAATGEEAIDLAMAEAFDLCIVDVRLPGLSGTETYTRLRTISPQIEGVFFTARQDFDRSKDFLRFALPPERVITKPVDDFGALTRLIVGILGPPKA